MADVLMGQAYFLRFDPKLWRAAQPYPPLGTLYAAAYLRERGVSVAVFDAMLAHSEREWAVALDRERPRLAVLYEDSFNYLSKMCLLRMREAALAMIDAARSRGCPVIVSGSDASDHPDVYLARGAAAVIAGEGEATLAETACRMLAAPVAGPVELADVRGLVLVDADGLVRRTPARPVARLLDDMPLPAWDLVDVPRYQQIWRAHHGYHSINLVTTRGCPFHCNWCAKPIYGQRYAVRSPAHVVDEIVRLRERYRPDHLAFVDDIFGLQPGWIASFADLMREAGATMPFRCLMRADQLDAGVVAALARAGCQMVWMGAESGSQRVLDAMEKGIRVEQIREASSLLHAAGIRIGFFLQFGYPGETLEDIEATLALTRELAPDDIGVSVSYPLPGTPFHDRVRAELGHKQNWVDSGDLAMMYQATYPAAFYPILHRAVHHEFRAGRQARRLHAAMRRPWRATPRDAARALSWGLNRAALAWTRRRLRHAAAGAGSASDRVSLTPALSPTAAATPSRQDD